MTVDVNSPLFIAMATVFATAALGLFGWSMQRIIKRIDGIAAQLDKMGNRLTKVETKQDAQSTVVRRTATKVGVRRLPPELSESA